mmetsp:Transcript_23703/g.26980  ORF Transcript_23703/g.26980 Transcript_23703/m.26980 type:complete len:111 (-) Transcript_23703:216-548(-)
MPPRAPPRSGASPPSPSPSFLPGLELAIRPKTPPCPRRFAHIPGRDIAGGMHCTRGAHILSGPQLRDPTRRLRRRGFRRRAQRPRACPAALVVRGRRLAQHFRYREEAWP